MAYIVESTVTNSASAATHAIDIGSPLTNDLILIFASISGSAAYSSGMTGYTNIFTSTNTTRLYCYYKVALSDSEADPSITLGFASSVTFVTLVIRDVDTTTPITNSSAGYATGTFTNVKEVTAPQITTGVGKTRNLIIHAAGITVDKVISDFGSTSVVAIGFSAGGICVSKEWVENASTATTAFTYLTNQSSSRTGNMGVVSINNKTSGGDGLRDISCLMTHTRLVKPYSYGTSETLTKPDTILTGATPLTSLAVASAAAAVSGYGTLSASYLTALNIATATNFGADTWAGFSWPTPFTLNMTGKIVGLAWNPTQPWSTVTTNANGVAIVFSDNVGAWAAYQIRTLATAYLNTDHIEFISPGVTATIGSSGSIDWTNITNVTWLYARKSGQTNTPTVNIASAYLFDGTSTLVGGSSTKPINALQIYKHLTQYSDALGTVGLYNFAAFQGSGQVLGYVPVQLGNGSTPTYVNLSANSFETPPDSTRLTDYDVTDASYGIVLYGSSTCTFDLRSALLVSSGLQTFTIHASSNLSASLLTTGASIIGRTFSDLAGYAWTSTSWSECATVAFKDSDLTTCSISSPSSTIHGTTGAACSFSANGAVVSGTTINCNKASGVTGYHLELGTAVTAITLTDVTFTGTPGTDKVHVLATTGTVTITISGTTSLAAGDVTSAGATVVISAPLLYQTVTVSGATAGSRIQIYDTTSSTELFNGTASAGDTVVSGSTATWTDPLAASANRAIRVRVSYVSGVTADMFKEFTGLTCGQTSGTESVTYPVTPEDDTVYNANGENGSTVYSGGEITFTDAAQDLVEMDIAAGSFSLQKMYAAWVYWVFTSSGIASDIDYINAIDTANYAFTGIKWKNTSSPTSPLKITGGYAWDSTTGDPMDLIDTTGGTIFLAPAHVVAYATGSGVTAQDITDIAAEVLTAAASTPIHADVRKVNSYTVDGDGQSGTEWGPA